VALRNRLARSARGSELFPGFTDVVELGIGSLSVVYQARETETNRPVALKLLNVRDASPRSIESFERESQALGALSSHPNIVTLYRTFRTPDGRPVLVLELCTGAVSQRLRGGTGLPVPEVLAIGIKIAGALETAHRAGILHRDVKPQNILITTFGEPALADFGVAMLQAATETTAGLFDFTTLHAAPELLEGGGTSAATDVYELASSLYQLIAGESAFRANEGESPASVILRILRDPVRPLSGANVPRALSDLLIRAMSKHKADRPPTAAEFASELAAVEMSQGWQRTPFLIREPGSPPTALPPLPRRIKPSPPAPAPPPAEPTRPADPPSPRAAAGAQPTAQPTAPLPPPPDPVAGGTPPDRSPGARASEPEPVDSPDDELPARATLRAGTSAVTVDDAGVHVRTGLRRKLIPWADIQGFESQLDATDGASFVPATSGYVVALTGFGPVELHGTRRPLAELREVNALLEAYHRRALRSTRR
jgi:serine/threonine protein kinase